MIYGNGFLSDLPRSLNSDELTPEEFAIRAGFVDKVSSGVYGMLPNGARVFNRLRDIIHMGINSIGGQEYVPPQLLPMAMFFDKDHNRLDKFEDEIFALPQLNGKYCLYPTGEEYFIDILKKAHPRASQMPILMYSTDDRFRVSRSSRGMVRSHSFLLNEVFALVENRPKSFDLASDIVRVYSDIFRALNLPFTITERKDPTSEKVSFDFDYDFEQDGRTIPMRFAQVNVLGNQLASENGLSIVSSAGTKLHPHMVGAGISLNRFFIGLIQTHKDRFGVNWPPLVAPFDITMIPVKVNSPTDQVERVEQLLRRFDDELSAKGVSSVVDLRNKPVGYRCATADVVGSIFTAVVGNRDIEQGEIDLKRRGEVVATISLGNFPSAVADQVDTLKISPIGISRDR